MRLTVLPTADEESTLDSDHVARWDVADLSASSAPDDAPSLLRDEPNWWSFIKA